MLAVSNNTAETSLSTEQEELMVLETLNSLTNELDEAMTERKEENSTRNLKRNRSLYKLSQQEFEELILNESELNSSQTSLGRGASPTCKKSRQITPLIDDLFSHEWDTKLDEIVSLDSSSHGISSLSNEGKTTPQPSPPRHDDALDSFRSNVYYDHGEEDLLKSIEDSFGDKELSSQLNSRDSSPENN